MNGAFRPPENIRTNARNSYLKLNHSLQEKSTGKNGLSYTGLVIWNRIP